MGCDALSPIPFLVRYLDDNPIHRIVERIDDSTDYVPLCVGLGLLHAERIHVVVDKSQNGMLLRIEAHVIRVENPSDCVSLRLERLAVLTPDIPVRRIEVAVPDDDLSIEVIARNVLVCNG